MCPIIIAKTPRAATAGKKVPDVRPAIVGLDVFLPKTDPELERERQLADLDNDLLHWKKATKTWQDDFTKNHKGAGAAEALTQARAFHEKQFGPLRRKYSANPEAAEWLRQEGNALVNRSIGFMDDFSRRESERYLEATLGEEEREVRRLFTAGSEPEPYRQEALRGYLAKGEAWRSRRGQSPEEINRWREDFAKSVAADSLRAGFEETLALDPDEALKMLDKAEGVPGAFRPDELETMRNRAAAAGQDKSRLARARADELVSGLKARIGRTLDSGDFSSLLEAERELAALGREAEAGEVALARQDLAKAQPFFEGSRFASFVEQRERLEDLKAEDSEKSELALQGIEKTIREREYAFRKDPAGFVGGHPLLDRENLSQEDYFASMLKMQADIGRGLDVQPRLLSNEQAAELRDGYEDLPDAKAKAGCLQKLAAESGDYATRVLAEAGFSAGLAGLAVVFPELPVSEVARVIAASDLLEGSLEATLKNYAALGGDAAELERRLSNEGVVQSLSAGQPNSLAQSGSELTEEQQEARGNMGWYYETDTNKEEDKLGLENAQWLYEKASTSERKEYFAAMTAKERCDAMAFFAAKYKDHAANPKYFEYMLGLQGVPPELVGKAKQFNRQHAAAKSDAEKRRLHLEFMDSLQPEDLPPDQVDKTKQALERTTSFFRDNSQSVKDSYSAWAKASTPEERKKVFESFFNKFAEDNGLAGISINWVTTGRRGSVSSFNLKASAEAAPSTWKINVNVDHPIWQTNSAEDFAILFSAIPHEFQHAAQLMAAREDSIVFKKGEKVRLKGNPSSTVVNFAGYFNAATDSSDMQYIGHYMIQPLEAQAHILQSGARKAMLEALSSL